MFMVPVGDVVLSYTNTLFLLSMYQQLLNGVPAGLSFETDPSSGECTMILANVRNLIRKQANLPDLPPTSCKAGARGPPAAFSDCLQKVINAGPIEGRLLEILLNYFAEENKWSGYAPTLRQSTGSRIEC